MHDVLSELEALTLSVSNRLSAIPYDDLEEFVDKRDDLIGRIRAMEEQKPSLVAYDQRIRQILQHDHAIMGRMLELKNEAAAALVKVDQGRKQKSTYETAYSAESYFFDKRK